MYATDNRRDRFFLLRLALELSRRRSDLTHALHRRREIEVKRGDVKGRDRAEVDDRGSESCECECERRGEYRVSGRAEGG